MIDNSMIWNDHSQNASLDFDPFGGPQPGETRSFGKMGSGTYSEQYDPFAPSNNNKARPSYNNFAAAPSAPPATKQADLFSLDEVQKASTPKKQDSADLFSYQRDEPKQEYESKYPEVPSVPAYTYQEEDNESEAPANNKLNNNSTVGAVIDAEETAPVEHKYNFEGQDFNEVDFAKLKADVDGLATTASNLLRHSREFVHKARLLTDESFKASLELKHFYDSNRSQVREFAQAKERAMGHVRFDKCRELEQLQKEKLDGPLGEWLEEYKRLKWKCEQRTAAHKRMLHYIEKVDKLQKSENKMRSTGKQVSSKGKDKLKRNDHKLDVARTEYNSLNTSVCQELASVWASRLELIDPVLIAFDEMEAVFYASTHEVHSQVAAVLKGVVETGDNGHLENLKFTYTEDAKQQAPKKDSWFKSIRNLVEKKQ